MKERKKVLYISQEIAPYLPDTPMSLMGRDLPQSTQEKGYEVRTFMPKYGSINERRNQLHEVIRLSGMNVSIDDADHPLIIKVATHKYKCTCMSIKQERERERTIIYYRQYADFILCYS